MHAHLHVHVQAPMHTRCAANAWPACLSAGDGESDRRTHQNGFPGGQQQRLQLRQHCCALVLGKLAIAVGYERAQCCQRFLLQRRGRGAAGRRPVGPVPQRAKHEVPGAGVQLYAPGLRYRDQQPAEAGVRAPPAGQRRCRVMRAYSAAMPKMHATFACMHLVHCTANR